MDKPGSDARGPEVDRRKLLKSAAVMTGAATAVGMSAGMSSGLAAAPLSPAESQTAPKPPEVPPAPTLKVSAVNFRPVMNDPAATAALIRGTIERLAKSGSQLIVFPEMALHGFESCRTCKDRGSACDRHLAAAERADGPLMRSIAEVVKQHDIYAIVGFGERDPIKPVIYNAAALFGPEGLIGTNRKMGLGKTGAKPFVSGEDMFAPGDAISVFPTRYGPIGVGICYDMWMNPEIPRLMVLRGAKILAIPTATVATTIPGDIEAMAFTRARENMVFVVNANLLGGGFNGDDGTKERYFSHSYIAGPQWPHMGKILAKTDDPFGVVTADVDLTQYERFVARSEIRKKRLASGINAHVSRIVARGYADYVGMQAV